MNAGAQPVSGALSRLKVKTLLNILKRPIHLVILLLDQDGAELLGQSVLTDRLTLANPLAVVSDGLGLQKEDKMGAAEQALGGIESASHWRTRLR